MEKFELKFIDKIVEDDFIKVFLDEEYDEILDKDIQIIKIQSHEYGKITNICLDKSTAIKFAKTLRTEINKITEREV